jgi:precorrin-3B methylase
MADTLGTPIMGDHVNSVSDSLTVAHMISLRLRVAASFEDRFIRTFWQAGSTVDTFGGNQ